MGVLVTTSYMDEAARCTRVGLAFRGRVVQEGRPGDLVAAFGDVVLRVEPGPKTCAERIEEVLAGLGPAIEGITPLGSGLRVVVRGADAARVEALLAATCAGVHRAAPGFEDLFLARAAALADGEAP